MTPRPVRPRCNRHSIAEKFLGGTEIECYCQTDDSCRRREDAEAEECDDGTFDADVNTRVP
jgi:hypothetical protein